jgi:hypothetical protein
VAAQPNSFFQIHCGGINTREQYEARLSLFSREVNPLGVVHFIAALILEFEGKIMQVPLFLCGLHNSPKWFYKVACL